jgi:ankyrin repeat protein
LVPALAIAAIPPLHKAAGEGRIDDIKALLAAGASVDERDPSTGATPLTVAAAFGQTDVVKLLLFRGANVNAQAKDGNTALIWAAQTPQSPILRMLLEKGANVNVRNEEGRTALFLALEDIDNTTDLLKHGADPNVSLAAAQGVTPLIAATSIPGPAGLAVVNVLLQHGADLTPRTTDEGNSALFSAAYVGRSDIVELLLSKGAKINDKNVRGNTALMSAASGTGFAVMDNPSAAPDRPNWDKVRASTPLYVDTIKVLLKHGADINQKNDLGWTALTFAELTARSVPDRKVIVQLLRSAGVPSAAKNQNFTGTWKINPVKSDFGQMPVPQRVDKIAHDDPILKIETEGEDFTWSVTLRTDGKETTNEIRGNRSKSVAKWEGDKLFVDTRATFNGNAVTIKEDWDLSSDGKTLTVVRRIISSVGETSARSVSDKQ